MDGANTEINSLKEWIDSKIKKPAKGTEHGLLLPVEKDENKERLRFVKL
jgi:translation elongation factor EF-Tu-like GTPase